MEVSRRHALITLCWKHVLRECGARAGCLHQYVAEANTLHVLHEPELEF